MTKSFGRSHVALLISAACCLSAPAPALAAGQPTPFIVDSAGKTVGPVVDESVITLEVKPGLVVRIDVRIDSIGVVGDEFFATTDCSGQTYLQGGGLLVHAYLDSQHAGTIIVPNTDSPATPLQSYRRGTDGACSTLFSSSKGFVVQSVNFDQHAFTPPFSAKLL